MDTLYWKIEFVKVLCGYMVLMFLWPAVVFSKHLKGKSRIYQFNFCTVVQVIIVNSVVLLLGLMHILNPWTVRTVFYGIFIINITKKIKYSHMNNIFVPLYYLITGTTGIKFFLYKIIDKLRNRIKKIIFRFRDFLQPHLMEYVILFVLALYGIVYFAYGAFQDYNFGNADIYVHHQWIYGLIEGNIFEDGIYPEGMHCFVYCLYTLFGIRVYSCLLFMAGIQITVFLGCAYTFLREIFQWKFTPVFVLVMFLMVDLLSVDSISSMARLSWTMPQEFGLHTQYLCALYLFRYLKSTPKVVHKGKNLNYYWDENLFLLTMSLAASIAIHFYDTIIAFFLCLPFALLNLRKIFTKERFFPLAAAVLSGVFIAGAPMIGAYVSGIPLQGSLNWGLSYIVGEEENVDTEKNTDTENVDGKITESVKQKTEDVQDSHNLLYYFDKLKNKLVTLYWNGYVVLYKERRAKQIVILSLFSTSLCISYHVGRKIQYRIKKKNINKGDTDGYLPLILASVIFMAEYTAYALGIPQLIAGFRLPSSIHMLLIGIVVIPIDIIFGLAVTFCNDLILQMVSMFVTAGIYYTIVASGHYHGFLYCQLTRYNSAVMVTNSITENLEKNTFTIVSTTDELYQVIQYGRHEELLDFIQGIQNDNYRLPTEHVFLYVEKRPLKYAHSHFYKGPSWLAKEKYLDIYVSDASRCPEISHLEISEEEAKKDIMLYALSSLSYSIPESRVILESKAYLWCQNFAKINPFEVSTYYEDDDFICYYFRQNPYALYNLAIEGWDRTDGIEW